MKFTRRDFFKSLGFLGLGFLPGAVQEPVIEPKSVIELPKIQGYDKTVVTGGSAFSQLEPWGDSCTVSASCSFTFLPQDIIGTPFSWGEVYAAKQRLIQQYGSLGVKTSKYDQWAKEVEHGDYSRVGF